MAVDTGTTYSHCRSGNLVQFVHVKEPLGKLFTHFCLCHQVVLFSTGQRTAMPYGWEGNRRSYWPCVADFSGLSTYGSVA